MKFFEIRRLPLVEAESIDQLLNFSLFEDSAATLTEENLVGSENFQQGQHAYHKKLSLADCPYRPYSLGEAAWILGYQDQYYLNEEVSDDLLCEGDDFYLKFGWVEEAEQLEEAEYQGRSVPLNKPMRGDVAKFKVYVKDPKTGNVKKVNFGDKNLRIRKSDPKRRKSFVARHKCSTAKDKTTARYWSCRGATSKVGGKW
jgi:hypothetical protein